MSSQNDQGNGNGRSLTVRKSQFPTPKVSERRLAESMGRLEMTAMLTQAAIDEASNTHLWGKHQVGSTLETSDKLEEIHASALESPERQEIWQGMTEEYIAQVDVLLKIFDSRLSGELQWALEHLDGDGLLDFIRDLFGG